jgi:hypothetical protein
MATERRRKEQNRIEISGGMTFTVSVTRKTAARIILFICC